jgi:predicted alpha/beta-fold hydrolase
VLKTAAAPMAHSTPSVELCRWSGVFISAQCVSVVPVPPSIDSLDLPPFRPRFPWWGPDLQTIAILLQPAMSDMSPHTSERVLFPMADRSGDILLGMLDKPAQTREGRPLVILVHGMTGCEDSVYMLSAARHLLGCGYTVLRLNVRGAGPSRPYCGELYHVGRTADFRRVLEQIPYELKRNGVVAIGYSLGGAMLLKYLGEEGSFSPLRAAASICAPIDLLRTGQQMLRPRNWVYHSYILNGLKSETLADGARLSDQEREIVRAARTVFDYDDRFISPRYGFRDARDYYALCAPTIFMPEIRVPTMVLAACDDPWIPIEHYREFDWSKNPWLLPVMPETGGHVGFHGDASGQPWCNLAIEKFLERVTNE